MLRWKKCLSVPSCLDMYQDISHGEKTLTSSLAAADRLEVGTGFVCA